MIGLAAFIAEASFVVLMVWGWAAGELNTRGIAMFVVLAAIALFGLPHLQANLVTSALAVIDIALVFIVFKGDVRIG